MNRQVSERSVQEGDLPRIEAELERTRAEMDATISQLQARLSPGELLEMGVAYLREGPGIQYVRNLRESVNRNPLPITLTAIGLLWTMVASRERSHGTAQGEEAGSSSRVGEAMGSVRRRLGAVKQRASETGEQARRRMEGMRSGERPSTGERLRQTGERGRAILQENPLVLAGAGLALGAAMAAMLPRTGRPDEWAEPPRDVLVVEPAEVVREDSEPPGPQATLRGSAGDELNR